MSCGIKAQERPWYHQIWRVYILITDTDDKKVALYDLMCLISPASRLLVEKLIQSDNKDIIKALHSPHKGLEIHVRSCRDAIMGISRILHSSFQAHMLSCIQWLYDISLVSYDTYCYISIISD